MPGGTWSHQVSAVDVAVLGGEQLTLAVAELQAQAGLGRCRGRAAIRRRARARSPRSGTPWATVTSAWPGQRLGERGSRGGDGRRDDHRAAAAVDGRVDGVRADHGYPADRGGVDGQRLVARCAAAPATRSPPGAAARGPRELERDAMRRRSRMPAAAAEPEASRQQAESAGDGEVGGWAGDCARGRLGPSGSGVSPGGRVSPEATPRRPGRPAGAAAAPCRPAPRA